MSSPTNAPPILTLTRSLTIRPFRTTDAESLAHHANDKEMYLNGPDVVPFPFTISSANAYISRALDSKTWIPSGPSWAAPALPFMYAIASDDVVIGSIEFCPGEDVRARSAKLGYWLGRGFWGKGIMTEVVGGFVEWVFGVFPKIVRVEAEVYDYNVRSAKVLERVGFVKEGTLKQAVWKEGKLAGLEIWAMVKASQYC